MIARQRQAAHRSAVSAGAAVVVLRSRRARPRGTTRSNPTTGQLPERQRPGGRARDRVGGRILSSRISRRSSSGLCRARARTGAGDEREARHRVRVSAHQSLARTRTAIRSAPTAHAHRHHARPSGERAVLRRRRHDRARVRARSARHAGDARSNGFALGGNALVILNAELRVPVRRRPRRRRLLRRGQRLRAHERHRSHRSCAAAVGFGVRYRSPIGPIRVWTSASRFTRHETRARPARVGVPPFTSAWVRRSR